MVAERMSPRKSWPAEVPPFVPLWEDPRRFQGVIGHNPHAQLRVAQALYGLIGLHEETGDACAYDRDTPERIEEVAALRLVLRAFMRDHPEFLQNQNADQMSRWDLSGAYEIEPRVISLLRHRAGLEGDDAES